MKKILLAAALTALTTTAFAADLKPYVEGSLGYMGIDNVKGKDTSGGAFGTKVDSDVTFGIEAGLKDVLLPGLRLGISDDYINAKGVSQTSSSSQIASINLYQANAYYDFKTSTPLTPYIGAGIGGYKNNLYADHELAGSIKAGVNYNINQNIYAGLKATYFFLDSAKTPSGSVIESNNAYSLNAVLGYQF